MLKAIPTNLPIFINFEEDKQKSTDGHKNQKFVKRIFQI